MPGGSNQQEIFVGVEQELGALREAIVANEIAAIERHTARVTELLSRLKPALQDRDPGLETQRRRLHDLTRDIFVLLQKSRRTVCALSGVYRFLLGSEHDAVMEPR